MLLRQALAILLFAAPALQAGNPGNVPARAEVTTWSRAAQALPYTVNPEAALRNARVPSPNGKYEIACTTIPKEEKVSETITETLETPACEFVTPEKRLPIDLQVGPEALWAPDSDAVAITNSRGGALGNYQVMIYRPGKDDPQDIAEAVRRDLARRFPACVGPEAGCTPEQRKSMEEDVVWVNVAAIRWMQNSDQLLMMAWVPDSSAFGANLGRYNGYVVDAHDGRILSRYSESEFKRRFKKYCGDWGL
jgi:hypothetical protein